MSRLYYPALQRGPMSSADTHFDEFGDHTQLKHAYLESYLPSWAIKLLSSQGTDGRVAFVDSFAGAGRDKHGNDGSPTIACRVAQQVKEKRHGSGRMDVYAIEKNPRRFGLLEAHLRRFEQIEHDHVFAMRGSASEVLPSIISRAGMAPTLYFLDPCGVDGLDASLYKPMLAGPRNEILALFDGIGASRLRGVVHAKDDDIIAKQQQIRAFPTLFEELDDAELQALEALREARVIRRSPTTPAARRALTLAIGSDAWESELSELNPEEFRRQFQRRFLGCLVDAGAKYLQVIPMRDAQGHFKYTLVHASKSVAAVTTMKEAVSSGLNRDELSLKMRERIREDLYFPMHLVHAALAKRFAGAEVRWSGDALESARRYLLEETPMFNFQGEEVRKNLKERGWLKYRKSIPYCEVPASLN
jgi:three-Cys-motif partner protein